MQQTISQPYTWVRAARGKMFGLKLFASPGYRITHWIIKSKCAHCGGKVYWMIDGPNHDGVVWGKHPTLKAAQAEVEKRMDLLKAWELARS